MPSAATTSAASCIAACAWSLRSERDRISPLRTPQMAASGLMATFSSSLSISVARMSSTQLGDSPAS